MNDTDTAEASRVSQLPAHTHTVIIQAELPHMAPSLLFDYWTQAPLLAQWWPPEAELELRPGGSYHLAWPQQDWHLRGEYAVVEPGRKLAFTWAWDQAPHTPTRHVTVDFQPAGDGTRLTVTQGDYGESAEDAEERQGHIDGWMFFLNRLANLETPSSPD